MGSEAHFTYPQARDKVQSDWLKRIQKLKRQLGRFSSLETLDSAHNLSDQSYIDSKQLNIPGTEEVPNG